MTSSTKPELHNVLQRRHKRTDPRPQKHAQKLVKFGCVVSDIANASGQTNRQTNKHTRHSTSHPSPGGENNN